MRRIITVDLDSTLADTRHRQHMIDRAGGTDWVAYAKACTNDDVIRSTAILLHLLAEVAEIHYVTGRPVEAAVEAEAWLRSHEFPMDGLWMDEDGALNDWASGGYHAKYKLDKVREVAEKTQGTIMLHIDDWFEVAVLLEQEGIPCMSIRPPQELDELTKKHGMNRELK